MQTPFMPHVSCLLGTSLGSVPGGSITKGIPSTRVPSESPITYRGSITHVGVLGPRLREEGGTGGPGLQMRP